MPTRTGMPGDGDEGLSGREQRELDGIVFSSLMGHVALKENMEFPVYNYASRTTVPMTSQLMAELLKEAS